MTVKHFKKLPEHLQPRIISAVAFIHTASPDIKKAAERLNKLRKHLSQKELMYVMTLLVFDELIDMVKDSAEFKSAYRNIVPNKRTMH